MKRINAAAIQWRNAHELYGIEDWEEEDVMEWCANLTSEFSQVLMKTIPGPPEHKVKAVVSKSKALVKQLQSALKQHSETTAVVDGRMLTTISSSLLERMGFSDRLVREMILGEVEEVAGFEKGSLAKREKEREREGKGGTGSKEQQHQPAPQTLLILLEKVREGLSKDLLQHVQRRVWEEDEEESTALAEVVTCTVDAPPPPLVAPPPAHSQHSHLAQNAHPPRARQHHAAALDTPPATTTTPTKLSSQPPPGTHPSTQASPELLRLSSQSSFKSKLLSQSSGGSLNSQPSFRNPLLAQSSKSQLLVAQSSMDRLTAQRERDSAGQACSRFSLQISEPKDRWPSSSSSSSSNEQFVYSSSIPGFFPAVQVIMVAASRDSTSGEVEAVHLQIVLSPPLPTPPPKLASNLVHPLPLRPPSPPLPRKLGIRDGVGTGCKT